MKTIILFVRKTGQKIKKIIITKWLPISNTGTWHFFKQKSVLLIVN